MPFDDLLCHVKEVKAKGGKVSLFSDEEKSTYTTGTKKGKKYKPRELAVYGLGGRYKNTYFTKREAQCMVLLLKGKTIARVANSLKLSPRTVEYYIKNMKSKLGCRTKFELIDLVYDSDFIKNVDFSL